MLFGAERPTGAPMDVTELEYCSALRQTDPSCLRSNGSITAEDIRLHLWSRHGVRVSIETVEQEILIGLAGGREYMVDKVYNEESKIETVVPALGVEARATEIMMSSTVEPERRITPLDIVQQVSILLIPELKKLAASSVSGGHTDTTTLGTHTALQRIDEDGGESKEADRDFATSTAQNKSLTSSNPQNPSDSNPNDIKKHGDVESGSGPDEQPFRSSHGNEDRATRNRANKFSFYRRPAADPLPTVEPNLVDAVLLVILETAGLRYGAELTFDAIQKILLAFGEEAWPKEVIEQMLVQASGKIGVGVDDNRQVGSPMMLPPMSLDRSTFLKALTADLDLYDERVEDRYTTYFTDANAAELEKKNEGQLGPQSPAIDLVFSYMVDRDFTASAVDYTADTYASFSWAILVWLSVGTVFFSYFFDYLQDPFLPINCNGNSFGCIVANAVVQWLQIMLKLCILGGLYVGLTSMGNSIYLLEFSHKQKLIGVLAMLVSLAMVVLVTIIPYNYDVKTIFFSTYKDPGKKPLYIATLVIGCLLLVLQGIQLVRILLPNSRKFREFAASSASALERNTKKAASFKVCRMMEHAVECHRSADSDVSSGSAASHGARNKDLLAKLKVDGRIAQALYRYQEKIFGKEKIGGILWTFKSLLMGNNTLARQEGVWIFPRLIWSHIGQWFVCGGFVYFAYYLSQLIREGSANLSFLSELDRTGLQIINAAGAACAIAVSLVTTIRFLPSAVTTVLCFRHGVHGSLRDPKFSAYRCRQDSGSTIFGSCVWGLIFTGLIFWVVVSLIVFGFLFYDTRPYFWRITAQIIGIATTILIKFLILQTLRLNLFAAFYRRRPALANLMMVVVECWNLGLSTGYILARAIKLISLSVFYISRIDTPFLAEGVGWIFWLPLDGFPLNFRQELLMHEAHRHPYMERWAFMYLLKLRHGMKFGTPAGAAWRILFTRALMPWLSMHRVHPEVREEWAQPPELGRATTSVAYQEMTTEVQNLKYEVQQLREQCREVETLREEVKRLRRQSSEKSLYRSARFGKS